jgi:endonuclease YncB( thermonuclease family)
VRILKLLPILALMIAVTGFSQQFLSQSKSNRLSKFGTVVKVIDGDTLTVQQDDKLTKIRLCGIDASERSQQFGKESKELLEKLTLNKEVAITEIEQDRYGRMVAEVFVTGTSEQFVNADLVGAGLAYHYDRYSGNCPNREVIVQAEGMAQQKRAGVWANSNQMKPWDYRRAH